MLETILNNFHLEKILWILRKRIAYIVILGVLGGMAGGAYAYLTDRTLYRAEVSFYVYSDPDYVYDSSINISNSEFTQAKNLVQSYILILKSHTVLEKVLEEAGFDYGTETLMKMITTSVVENTAVFYVYAYDSDPYRAAELANAIGRVAPKEIGRIVKSGGIEVIDYATLPQSPYSATSLVKYALVGFTGNPGIIELAKMGIVVAWAYAESILDLRTLLAGGKVALIKSAENWTLGLSNLSGAFSGTQKVKESEDGFSYEDYLQKMLYFETQEKLNYRAMDLIEKNVRVWSGNQNLRMDSMAQRMKVTVCYEAKPLFLRLVRIGDISDETYQFTYEKKISYLDT